MAKIVFVNPPLRGVYRHNRLIELDFYSPRLGLACLAAVTKREGFDTYIIDCQALKLNKEEAVKEIISLQPDYIGITAVTCMIHAASELTRDLKKIIKCPIIIGGVHITLWPEETMETFRCFGIGAIGEGELTIVELLKTLENKGDLGRVKGIIYREKDSLKKTNPRPVIEDIDTLPFPAWELLPDLSRYFKPPPFNYIKTPWSYIMISRGCSFPCSFCCIPVLQGSKDRQHSARYIFEMMKKLRYQYGIKDITLADGEFGVDRNLYLGLCDLLIKEKMDLVWSCRTRVDLVDQEFLCKMKEAGCWGIAYGVESGSQKVLDTLNRNMKLEDIATALKWTRKAGIKVTGYIMIGMPNETKQTLNETINFILKIDMDVLIVSNFTPLPGTLVYKRANQYGEFDKDWHLINFDNMVFIPYGLTKKDIEYYERLINLRFYLRPKTILEFFKKPWLLRMGHIGWIQRGLLVIFKFIWDCLKIKLRLTTKDLNA